MSSGAITGTAPTVLVKVEYWHKDHLGSLVTTTDHTGTVTQRYAYDPFGKRRFVNGNYDAFGTLVLDWSPTLNAGTDRGYTGHEHLDDVGLVHMNGRIFDPTLGVFLQGDPFVQNPGNLQNYNRYGYCYNNPLSCTDPSGQIFGIDDALFVFMAITSAVVAHEVPELRPFIGIAWAIALGGAPGPWTGAYSGIANAATAGFMSGAIASGGTLQGGIQGAFSAAMFFGAGNVIGGGDFFAGGKGAEWSTPAGVALHGVVGCVTSVAGGGKCGPGALSAAFSQAALPMKEGLGPVGGTVVSMVIGGTASELGGGTFANGARTAAFGYLFNYCMHDGKCFTTASERALLDKRDFAGYYKLACEGNDAYACQAGDIAAGKSLPAVMTVGADSILTHPAD